MSYFTLKVYKLYQSAMPSTAQVKNITKFDTFENKYLSRDLISILHNDSGHIGSNVSGGMRGGEGKPEVLQHIM